MAKVIVTGASGFIGGQTVLQLKDSGYNVIGIDTRPAPATLINLFNGFIIDDFASDSTLHDIVRWHSDVDAIVHCAGTSLVGPSIKHPETYYKNNFVRTKKLLDTVCAMGRPDLRVIFSSSAAVYGEPVMTPCQEEDPPLPLSPYGESKYMVEMMMQSYFRAYGLQPVMFRYFNACGADPDMRHGQESGATHIVAKVLESIKNNTEFTLYGDNYLTVDGTCIRDYVHVADIARAHVLAIHHDIPTGIYNLGSNQGVSNREIIAQAETITGKKVKVNVGEARPGDPTVLTANSARFNSVANGWQHHTLADMIQHAWAWYNKQ